MASTRSRLSLANVLLLPSSTTHCSTRARTIKTTMPSTPKKPTTTTPVRPTSPAPFLYPAAPPTPLPWVWQCHKCRSTYHLSTTRRCLEDGHNFCSSPSSSRPTRSPSSPSSSTSDSNANINKPRISSPLNPNRRTCQSANTSPANKPSRSRQRSHRGCSSSFDYTGWELRNAWRRDVDFLRNGSHSPALPSASPSSSPLASRDPASSPAPGRAVDCWRTCSFPSECRHKQAALAAAAATSAAAVEAAVEAAAKEAARNLAALCARAAQETERREERERFDAETKRFEDAVVEEEEEQQGKDERGAPREVGRRRSGLNEAGCGKLSASAGLLKSWEQSGGLVRIVEVDENEVEVYPSELAVTVWAEDVYVDMSMS